MLKKYLNVLAAQHAAAECVSRLAQPDLSDAYQLMLSQQFTKALETLLRLVERHPFVFEAWEYIAYSHYSLGQGEDALNAYRKALDLQPGNSRTLHSIGNVLRETGHYEEAVEYYGKVLQNSPYDMESLKLCARCYVDLGRLSESRATLERATRVAPGDAEAHFLLGRLCILLHDVEAAKRELGHLRMLDTQMADELSSLLLPGD